jgi:rubrerythrin
MKNEKKFQRTIEDFTCEHCGYEVTGDGFTNHCPKCLWSKHVDINPGDRLNSCGGLMEPIAIEQKHGDNYIVQQCRVCGFKKRNRQNKNDDTESIIRLSAQIYQQN